MAPATAQQPPTVLMVDDDLELLEEYRELLECDGLIAAICDSPVRAVELLRQSPSICVVLSDLRMDGMSGATMIEQMRSALPERPLSFALVTGAADVEPELCGPEVRILYKPVDPDELVTTINDLMPR